MVWPPDYNTEFKRRIDLIKRLRSDESLLSGVTAFYKTHPVEWINDFCVTVNPRNKAPMPKVVPFLLFPKQVDFIQWLQSCLDDGESGLCEKSRDMGATWLCCAFSVWLWLFHPGSSVGWGSRDQDTVDESGNPDSIFEKIRTIIANLPAFMLPRGLDPRRHMTFMKVINPENGASIKGDAGDNIGRGGRSTIYFKDESAHYVHPELIEAALGDNTDVQIDISSVAGSSNVFYRRRMAGEIWAKGKAFAKGMTRVFIMDWRDHPGKTLEWYEARKAKFDREGLSHVFAQEVDRDYNASTEGIIIPQKWVKASIDAHIVLGLKVAGEKVAALDVADEGGDKNACGWRHGVILQFSDDWAEGDTGQTTQRAIDISRDAGVYECYYDCIGVGAGVKSEFNRLMRADQMGQMRFIPWNAAAEPLDKDDHIIPWDDKSPTNNDVYRNLKAQSWWRLRIRFEKTYKAVTQGIVYPPEELISLPSILPKLHEITMQLSQATKKKDVSNGKLIVDKKPNGAHSPNLADMITMLYNPTRVVSILDVL